MELGFSMMIMNQIMQVNALTTNPLERGSVFLLRENVKKAKKSAPSLGNMILVKCIYKRLSSWKLLERMKTVNASCLFKHDFVSSCTGETHPWPKSSKKFEQVFMTDKFEEGGCPPVNPDDSKHRK